MTETSSQQLTEAMVVSAVNQVCAVNRQNWEPVQADTPIEGLAFDSLDLAEVFATLEDWSGLDLDPDSVWGIETVGDLARLRAL
jgi:acyl carrier protein